MTDDYEGREIPKVELRLSQKLILIGLALIGVFMLVQAAAQPISAWDWVKFIAAVGYAAIQPIIARAVPTEKQQGAVHIAGAVMDKIAEGKAVEAVREEFGAPVALPQIPTQELQAIVAEATAPRPGGEQ